MTPYIRLNLSEDDLLLQLSTDWPVAAEIRQKMLSNGLAHSLLARVRAYLSVPNPGVPEIVKFDKRVAGLLEVRSGVLFMPLELVHELNAAKDGVADLCEDIENAWNDIISGNENRKL